MADGFLGRWAQRKQAVREGRPLDEPSAPATSATPEPAPPEQTGSDPNLRSNLGSDPICGAVQPPPEPPPQPATPAPTLDDVNALTADSSFAPFVARNVAPEVRNAAMKKLFADPHYNVMDRLDIYIDDYALPSPLPAAMLGQMVSAQFLKLVEEVPSVEQPPSPNQDNHDDTDLRLQPDHAPEPEEPGRGAE